MGWDGSSSTRPGVIAPGKRYSQFMEMLEEPRLGSVGLWWSRWVSMVMG